MKHLLPVLLLVPAVAKAQAPRPLMLGDVVQGELARGDVRLDGGEYVHHYALNVMGAEAFELRLESSAFNTYLMVDSPLDVRYENEGRTQKPDTNTKSPPGS